MGASLVLLVEDDRDLREAVAELLAVRLGVEVLQAEDGATALTLARQTRPALVMVDHKLPGVGGLEVARRLRADPETAALPILSLSGSSEQPAALAAGCDAYVVKPFRPERLLETVRRMLARPSP